MPGMAHRNAPAVNRLHKQRSPRATFSKRLRGVCSARFLRQEKRGRWRRLWVQEEKSSSGHISSDLRKRRPMLCTQIANCCSREIETEDLRLGEDPAAALKRDRLDAAAGASCPVGHEKGPVTCRWLLFEKVVAGARSQP